MKESCTDTHWQDFCGVHVLIMVLTEYGCGKFQTWNVHSCTAKRACFSGQYKCEREKKNREPMWDKLMKQVDLEEPTLQLDLENLGCTQRECKPTRRLCKKTKTRSNLWSQQLR